MQPKSRIVLAEKKLDWMSRRITLDAGEHLIPGISQNKSEWCRLRIADLQFGSVRERPRRSKRPQPTQLGLAFFPATLALACGMPVVGRVIDEKGVRLPTIAGSIAPAIGFVALATLAADADLQTAGV